MRVLLKSIQEKCLTKVKYGLVVNYECRLLKCEGPIPVSQFFYEKENRRDNLGF